MNKQRIYLSGPMTGIVAKQTKNEGRTWPDWRSAAPGKAIEHVRGEEVTT